MHAACWAASAAMTPNMKRFVQPTSMRLGSETLQTQSLRHVRASVIHSSSESIAHVRGRSCSVSRHDSLHLGHIMLALRVGDTAAFVSPCGYPSSGALSPECIGAVAPESVCLRNQILCMDSAAEVAARRHDDEYPAPYVDPMLSPRRDRPAPACKHASCVVRCWSLGHSSLRQRCSHASRRRSKSGIPQERRATWPHSVGCRRCGLPVLG